MRVTFVLFQKELRSLFSSWIAYVVLIAFTMLNGVTFYIYLNIFRIFTRYSNTIEEGSARQGWNLVENLISPLYNTTFILLFIMVPAITMRMFAEEKKQRTEELLLTSPVRISEIVLAKYLAAATLITLMLIPLSLYPAITIYFGRPQPDWGPMLTGFIGLFLLGYSLAAIGIFSSSMTENQIVAFIVAVALEMLLFIVSQATITLNVVRLGDKVFDIGSVLRAFSITDHFEPLLSGLIRASDIFYFVSLVVFWLWATHQSVESSRWS